MSTHYKSYLPFLGRDVWYDQSAVGNILSLANIMDWYHITMHTDPEHGPTHQITVHLSRGSDLDLCRGPKDLFYHDQLGVHGRPKLFNSPKILMTTVEDNLKLFPRCQRAGICEKVGFPSHDTFTHMAGDPKSDAQLSNFS